MFFGDQQQVLMGSPVASHYVHLSVTLCSFTKAKVWGVPNYPEYKKVKMSSRFKMGKVQPGAYKAMNALEQFISSSSVTPLQREMINIRASQINGCAYCVNIHTRDARKHGETEQRIYLISVWREAPNVFSEEEQWLLQMTEEITLIHQQGLSDALYEKAIAIWGEERTAQVIMAIITINAWNRIGVGLKMHPEL